MKLSFDVPSTRAAPALVRDGIRPLAAHMAPAAYDDLALVVSELVSNSVLHGPARGVTVELSLEPDGLVRGEVHDQGDGVVAIREAVADDEGGFGLRLVDRLATRWGVVEGSTNVWFEMEA